MALLEMDFDPATIPYPSRLDSLPEALSRMVDAPRWCVWRWEVSRTGKPTKVPYQAAWPDIHARTNTPATWGGFADAVAAVAAGRADGIGYMLHDGDVGAFDLDDCRCADTGEVDAWAAELVERSGSYAEATVSGTGLRIIGLATGAYVHRKHRWPDSGGSIETYRRATRFIVVTGQEVCGPHDLASIDELIDETVMRLDAKTQPSREKGFSFDPSDAAETDLPPVLDRLVRGGVAEGERSDQFMHVVGWLKDLGWRPAEIEDLLARHPEGIAAKYAGRLRREVDRCWDKARERSARSSYGELPPQPDAPAADPLAGVTFDGDTVLEPPRMLVKGLLPRSGVAFLGGQSGAGKSFVAFDLAVSLAIEEPFFGRKVRERVGSIIIAAEGAGTIAPRLEALRHTKAQGVVMPIAWLSDPPDLTDRRALPAFVERLRAIAERLRDVHGVRVGLVVIDTMAAAFGFKDPNDAAEAQRAMKMMQELGLALDALVVPIHHYGKDKETGLRGSTAFRGAGDAVLSVLGDRNEITGEVTDRSLALAKSRIGPEGPIAAFDIASIKLGVDEDGDDWFAGYVVPNLDEPVLYTKAEKRAKSEPRPILALKAAFDEVMIGEGRTVRVMGDGPEVRAVTLNQIRPEFRRRYVTGEDDDAKVSATVRKAFGRAIEAAGQFGFATGNWSEEEWIWRP